MDRRQKRTRETIFRAFTALLAKKEFHQITVGEIIERADVGRATFYAHFETKDDLLKSLCEELFAHIFESVSGNGAACGNLFDCDAPDSVFLHLFLHLQKNDNQILELFSCQNNELFLSHFKKNLRRLVQSQLPLFEARRPQALPQEFWIHHIAATFVETVRFWIAQGRKESPETMVQYFFLLV